MSDLDTLRALHSGKLLDRSEFFEQRRALRHLMETWRLVRAIVANLYPNATPEESEALTRRAVETLYGIGKAGAL